MNDLTASELDRLAIAHRGPIGSQHCPWDLLPLALKNRHREAAKSLYERGFRLAEDCDENAVAALEEIKRAWTVWRQSEGVLLDRDGWLLLQVDRALTPPASDE